MRYQKLLLIGLLCCATAAYARTVVGEGQTVVVSGAMVDDYLLDGGELIVQNVPVDLGKLEFNAGTLRAEHGFGSSGGDDPPASEFPLYIDTLQTIHLGLWDMTDWGLDTVAVLQGGALHVYNCIIAAEQVAFCCQETTEPLTVIGSYFARSHQASIQMWDGDLEIDSCRFVTNNVAIRVNTDAQVFVEQSQFIESSQAIACYDADAVIQVEQSDFLLNQLYDVNCYYGTAVLTGCYSDGSGGRNGDVVIEDPAPGQLYTDPPDPKATTPDAIAPDQLEWVEVGKTPEDLPIRVVYYRVYRSDSPYGVFAPENLIATTTHTWYSDPGHGGLSHAFYVITAVSGP